VEDESVGVAEAEFEIVRETSAVAEEVLVGLTGGDLDQDGDAVEDKVFEVLDRRGEDGVAPWVTGGHPEMLNVRMRAGISCDSSESTLDPGGRRGGGFRYESTALRRDRVAAT
jgi:hypothetical protein